MNGRDVTKREPSSNAAGDQWRCDGCNKLLGVLRKGRLEVRASRMPAYEVGLPASARCLCGYPNSLMGSAARPVPSSS